MKRQDFTFVVDRYGYMLYYKGMPLGGASTLDKNRKMHWKHARANIKMYSETSEREINLILQGAGQSRFIEAINKIDKKSS